jgi:two-component system, chemotaxis family, protein-glutamate methylesterase/glutaminase
MILILFCEECGEKIEIDEEASGQARIPACRVCGESLNILDREGIGGRNMQAVAALEQDGGRRSSDRRIKVLIVDDSKFFRRVFRQILNTSPLIEIVGEAADGSQALAMIEQHNPDVVTMDVNMPVMDGIKALKHLMIKSPRPTVMFSTLTTEGAHETFDALRYGAIDFIPKPSRLSPNEIEAQQDAIVRKIKLAANVEIDRIKLVRTVAAPKGSHDDRTPAMDGVVILGASEGGYGTFLKIAPRLGPDLPCALIAVLYAEPAHVNAFVDYLESQSRIRVRRAKDGQLLEGGTLYFVCGTEYATVKKENHDIIFGIHTAPFPTRKGSIDMLMFSLAELMEEKTVGIVLSGSGRDGAEGIQEIHRLGGTPIVQAPKTCLVKGMPMAAIGRCGAARVVSDAQLAAEINNTFAIH